MLTWNPVTPPYNNPNKVNVTRAKARSLTLEVYALETGGAELYYFDAWIDSPLSGEPDSYLKHQSSGPKSANITEAAAAQREAALWAQTEVAAMANVIGVVK